MPPTTSSLVRAARSPVFRASRANFFTSQAARTQFRSSQFRSQGKRWQSTVTPEATVQQTWFKRMWESPIGLKTVHFWAPVMKWSIVIAGISDFFRPADKLSLTQNLALTATGAIWTRWCLIIKPRNVLLASVNFFLGAVAAVQVTRILSYNASVKDQGAKEQLEEAAGSVKDTVKGLEKNVENAIKS